MIHQLVHTLSYGDAISTEVRALQRVLRARGVASEIYAINVHSRYAGEAKDYRDFPKDFSGEVVLHYSLGSPLNGLYRSLSKAKRTLIYHNITPPCFFSRVNPRVVSDIEAGLRELPELCRMSDRCIADSRFNAEELKQYGVNAEVLELLVDPVRWGGARNEGLYALLKNDPCLHIIHVGRFAPNKCLEDIIKAFYFIHHHAERRSKLWLAGIDIDTELYSFSLRRLVDELGLFGKVQFVGGLADEEIRSLYEAGSVYICASEHEGFCLPVVEAMHFGLPVIAFNASATPETVGDGGIVIDTKDPALLAEVVLEVWRNAAFRERIVARGHARVAHFQSTRFEADVERLFCSARGELTAGEAVHGAGRA